METLASNQRQEVAIIIPACDEAPVIGAVLRELLRAVDLEKCAVIVGVNGSTDATARIAREFPVLVAETNQRGYGYGCVAAMRMAEQALPALQAFVFFAGDGASDPRDLRKLLAARDQGYDLVLGARTTSFSNWRAMSLSHVVANFALAAWCGLLSRRWFADLAPLRLITCRLAREIAPREMTYGWTIETQIAAAKLGAAICEVRARERRRLAGEQKVSGVDWRRTVRVGLQIVAAGWRSARRYSRRSATRRPVFADDEDLVAHPQRGS